MHLAAGDRITVRKLAWGSREVSSQWTGVVLRASRARVVVHAAFQGGPWELDGVVGGPGDEFTEFYFPGRWYNVFYIADPDGRQKGWYCNVTRPPAFDESGISFVDLKLDVFVHPDGRWAVLDEDEFAAAMGLATDAGEVAQARATLDRLIDLAKRGRLPRPPGRAPGTEA